MKSMQRGGTILGLIIGILFGLAVALAVAVYVAKVPVPFTNKNQPRSNSQDEAEAQKNKDWNPNSPLRGRNTETVRTPSISGSVGDEPTDGGHPTASRPAPAVTTDNGSTATPAPTGAASAAQRPAPAVAQPRTSASSPARGAQHSGSEDPLGDLVRERAGANANANSSDPFTYFVQAGAFRTADDAEAQRARLNLMGIQAKVSEREQAGRTVYRVRVGPFDNKDAADRAKSRLENNSVESALVRVQR